MLRAILLLIVLFLVSRVVLRLLRANGATASKPGEKDLTHMVRCAHCATFVPATDALMDGELPYCSDAHRRLGPGQSA